MRFQEPKHKSGHFKVTRPELIKVNMDLRPPQLAIGYGPPSSTVPTTGSAVPLLMRSSIQFGKVVVVLLWRAKSVLD